MHFWNICLIIHCCFVNKNLIVILRVGFEIKFEWKYSINGTSHMCIKFWRQSYKKYSLNKMTRHNISVVLMSLDTVVLDNCTNISIILTFNTNRRSCPWTHTLVLMRYWISICTRSFTNYFAAGVVFMTGGKWKIKAKWGETLQSRIDGVTLVYNRSRRI